jgi:hypothetical protein
MMARFSSSAGTYPNACKLIDALKDVGIDANITAGGVAIYCSPDQIDMARSICKLHGASFDAGFTSHQEDVMLRSQTGHNTVERVTRDALSVMREWE